ncbi:hypothetical protein [Candidatus Leptofilum sp.]|uniref:hypothetical protein n=1 Tax=Candidatus Leptofilum sp. TaxID=3241576 RepID=UPI003B58CCEA
MGHSVVDASVGIKLFVDETGSAAAHQLFSELVADPPLIRKLAGSGIETLAL